MKFFLAVLALLTAISDGQMPVQTRAVGNCPRVTEADLGRTDVLNNTGLVSLATLTPNGIERPLVRILEYQVVCEAAGLTRDTVSATSVVVRYECQGVMQVCPMFVLVQYLNLDCRTSNSFLVPEPDVQFGSEINPANNSSLSVPLNTRCGVCTERNSGTDHCIPCDSACNEGQRRCIGIDSNQCCNWYLNNTCVITCPSQLVGDMTTFNCGCTELSFPPNGNISYSNRFAVNSIATHTCDASNGYVLSDPSANTRTCMMDGNWSGNNITCQLFDCNSTDIMAPVNGRAPIDRTTLSSVVTFTCNDGYVLVGNATRTCQPTGWSGSNPTCVFDCGSTVLILTNGRVIIDQTTLGSVARFMCNNGFVLRGDTVTRTCEVTGWSGSNPSCVRVLNVPGIVVGSVIGALVLIILIIALIIGIMLIARHLSQKNNKVHEKLQY